MLGKYINIYNFWLLWVTIKNILTRCLTVHSLREERLFFLVSEMLSRHSVQLSQSGQDAAVFGSSSTALDTLPVLLCQPFPPSLAPHVRVSYPVFMTVKTIWTLSTKSISLAHPHSLLMCISVHSILPFAQATNMGVFCESSFSCPALNLSPNYIVSTFKNHPEPDH